jgi:hypothetical protein
MGAEEWPAVAYLQVIARRPEVIREVLQEVGGGATCV